MANTEISAEITLDIKIHLELSVAEATALSEMIKYGPDAFLQGYYKQLGKSYMQPHEKGLRSLFETIRTNLPAKLSEVQEINKVVKELKTKR